MGRLWVETRMIEPAGGRRPDRPMAIVRSALRLPYCVRPMRTVFPRFATRHAMQRVRGPGARDRPAQTIAAGFLGPWIRLTSV